jgi:hypothetical protein
MKQYLPFLLAIILFTSSCTFIGGKRVRGDGQVVTRERDISGFIGVDVSGAINVVITQDSGYAVKVEADNNLHEFIEVYIDHQVLHIHSRERFNLRPSRAIIVYVSAPTFSELYASGACQIKTNNRINSSSGMRIDISGASGVNIDVNSPKVELEMSGACNAIMKGQTRDFSVDGSGSTEVKAFELLSENTDVNLSGAGSAEVYASVKLDAEASGAASVRYKGKASMVANTSGASSVKKVDN